MDARRVADVAATRRRATCIWLARLASLRAGVIQYLVRQCDGTLGDVLECDPAKLQAMLARRGSAGACQASDERGAAPGAPLSGGSGVAGAATARQQACSDAREYRRLLHRGPAGSDSKAEESTDAWRPRVCWGEAGYPPGLLQLHDPPPALFVRGTEPATALAAVARRPVVAVVGAGVPHRTAWRSPPASLGTWRGLGR